MANVVTHSRFQLNELDAETLKGMGVEVLTDFPSDVDLGLADVVYGEEVLAVLSPEEFSIFVEMKSVSDQLSLIQNETTARKLREVADRAAKGEPLLSASVDAVKHLSENLFASDEEEDAFFQLTAKMNLLKATFYWVLGERYSCHSFNCGVRTKRRFVKVKKRTANG